jgi:hypothetical protein
MLPHSLSRQASICLSAGMSLEVQSGPSDELV